MSKLMLTLVSVLALAACGEVNDQDSAFLDPSVGLDETLACASPSWYCAYIGAIGVTGAIGSCGSVTTSAHTWGDYVHETLTCQNGGSQWNVYDTLGLAQLNIGGYVCNATQLDTYNTRITFPGTPICKRGVTHSWTASGWTTVNHYQNHFVNNPGTCIGAVQCIMDTRTWCSNPSVCG